MEMQSLKGKKCPFQSRSSARVRTSFFLLVVVKPSARGIHLWMGATGRFYFLFVSHPAVGQAAPELSWDNPYSLSVKGRALLPQGFVVFSSLPRKGSREVKEVETQIQFRSIVAGCRTAVARKRTKMDNKKLDLKLRLVDSASRLCSPTPSLRRVSPRAPHPVPSSVPSAETRCERRRVQSKGGRDTSQ